VPLADDAEIVARVDEIAAVLFAASIKTWRTDNQRWKERYRWFLETMAELHDDVPSKPLHG
jgi:hypothetical protein